MRETENLNFSISQNINGNNTSNRSYFKKTINYNDVVDFIKSKNLSKEIEEKLLKIAKNTPHGSLENFKKNYKRFIK